MHDMYKNWAWGRGVGFTPHTGLPRGWQVCFTLPTNRVNTVYFVNIHLYWDEK